MLNLNQTDGLQRAQSLTHGPGANLKLFSQVRNTGYAISRQPVALADTPLQLFEDVVIETIPANGGLIQVYRGG
jgi:hypothetical protein